MTKIRNIAIFTSIRSEYGLLKSLIKVVDEDEYLNLSLLVGGSHLLEEYGKTITEIEKDGFPITYKLPFLFSDGEPDVSTRSMAALASQISTFLHNSRPDLLVILGDRFELLPVVNASLILNIPIAHISGGEITEGAVDNQIRHAISKMSHLHFVATDQFKNNLIKMGEEAWRICVCGELGLDEILNMDYIGKVDLFENLGLEPSLPV
ncbi:MAG: UDP-N-acetylglucosamine 2-epimerase, partial [Bacteroidetes bacterium]|nr:UDP-N-acetylglucosamine 2-epimerase [Bacteroidota bacterium]